MAKNITRTITETRLFFSVVTVETAEDGQKKAVLTAQPSFVIHDEKVTEDNFRKYVQRYSSTYKGMNLVFTATETRHKKYSMSIKDFISKAECVDFGDEFSDEEYENIKED